MAEPSNDDGVIAVLLERFQKQRLPRALQLKEKVDNGEKLNESDIAFLKEIFSDANHIKPLADKHPEYQDLVTRALHLYHEITERGLKNEQGS